MNRELARKIADAVLYEGYMLYPYRPSAIKNRQRWCFGILYPPAYEEVGGGTERSSMHSECLLKTSGGAAIKIQLRFLHLMARQVFAASSEPVASLTVDGRLVETWDEGIERSVEFEVNGNCDQKQPFHFAGSIETESLRDGSGNVLGSVSRTQHEITGAVSVTWHLVSDGVLKLTIDIRNETPFHEREDRNAALLRSLVSSQILLGSNGGEFVSLLDPSDELRDAVRDCNNLGNFPVLIGAEGDRDTMLCSPILLSDYPQIAPESAGDFYDGTEMDEMLTLRVMTLTDEEKAEMRSADAHAYNLLQRTEQSAREQLMRTHGTVRSLRTVNER